MSIRDYLEELDTTQLQFAIQEANRIIGERKNQEKIPIYLVSDDVVNWYAFEVGQENEAMDAAVHVLESQRERFKEMGLNYDNIQVNINVMRYSQHEADVYLENLK